MSLMCSTKKEIISKSLDLQDIFQNNCEEFGWDYITDIPSSFIETTVDNILEPLIRAALSEISMFIDDSKSYITLTKTSSVDRYYEYYNGADLNNIEELKNELAKLDNYSIYRNKDIINTFSIYGSIDDFDYTYLIGHVDELPFEN